MSHLTTTIVALYTNMVALSPRVSQVWSALRRGDAAALRENIERACIDEAFDIDALRPLSVVGLDDSVTPDQWDPCEVESITLLGATCLYMTHVGHPWYHGSAVRPTTGSVLELVQTLLAYGSNSLLWMHTDHEACTLGAGVDDEWVPGIGHLLAPLLCETGGLQCCPFDFASHMSATWAAALLAGGANPFHATRMPMIRMMARAPGLGTGVVQLACEPISPANVHLFPVAARAYASALLLVRAQLVRRYSCALAEPWRLLIEPVIMASDVIRTAVRL